VAQPQRAGGPGGGPARPSPAGPLPRQPGPARHSQAGVRPGGVLDRRVGHPRPAGAAGHPGRGHLPRAVLRGRPGAGRPRGAVAAVGRGAHRAHGPGHRDAAARRVAGDREAPQRPWLPGLARGRHRPGVTLGRPAPVLVLAGPRHAGGPRHLVSPGARGAGARDHDPGARVGQRDVVGALRLPARRRPRQRRPHPRAAECLARDGRGRVPAAAEPGTSRRGPGLVLHVERQGGGRASGPGRAAAASSSPPTAMPGPRSRRKSSSPA